MKKSHFSYHLSIRFHYLILSIITLSTLCTAAAAASDILNIDTLVHVAQTEVSLSPLSPELIDSKNILEKTNSSKTREQLYREIFGIPPPKPPRQLEASLTVNEKVNGIIEVIFSEDRTDFSIPAAPVISMIAEMISPELLTLVKSKINSSGLLTKNNLDNIRLETIFESQDYVVHIKIPADLLSKQVHDLKGYRADPYMTEHIKPNAVSAYLNAHINEKLRYFQSASNDTLNMYYKISKRLNIDIRQPLTAKIDGAVNIKGVVLEGGGTYNEMYNNAVQKNSIRLVYDLPKHFLRLSAGDVTYKTTGYLSYVPTGGIGISKDYTLQPHINSYPVSDREFFLTEQSEVYVWVNDILVKSLLLEPGTHDIRGFPFATGSNNVRIETRDFSGRIETLEFSFIHEPVLLAKGKSHYFFNIGLPSRIYKNEYVYKADDPYLVATYKRGLTDNFSFEVYGQSFLDRGMVGTNGIYALSLGNVHADLAGSFDAKKGADLGAKLGFFYRSKVSYSKDSKSSTGALQRINPITWNTRMEYLGDGFPRTIQDSSAFYEKQVRFSTDLTIPMPGQFNFNLTSAFNIYPDSNNIFEIGMGIQKTLFRSLRAAADFRYSSDTRSDRANPYVSVRAQWTFNSGPNNIAINETVTRQPPASSDTLLSNNAKKREWDFTTDVNWDYLSTYQRPGKISGGISAHIDEMYSNYNGRVGYSGNAGSIEFNQNLGTPGYFQEQFIQHQSDLTLKTSLVFADGTLALSRPVYNSFMIAKGTKNLKGSTIRINPYDKDDYEATSTWFGPAALPLQSPYTLKKIKVSPLNSSVASINDQVNFTLFPHYKSGFLLKVGSDITVLVIGTLLDKNGNTLNYQAINITAKDNSDFKPISTFTNQAGKFQFMGTAGQTYEMRLDGTPDQAPVPITIPEDEDDYYRVGEIRTGALNPEPSQSSTVDESDAANGAAPSLSTPASDSDNVIDTKTAEKPVDPNAKVSYIFGTLRDSSGTPMPLTSFEIIPVDDPSAAPIRSFTNKDGNFQFISTKPAKYRIATTESTDSGSLNLVDTFSVTEATTGLQHHIGNLKLNKSEIPVQASKKDTSTLKVTGTLENKEGAPFKLTPVSAISIDTLINTFTDDNGTFQFITPTPGKYMIYITGSKTNTGAFITLKPEDKGIIDVGRQRIEQ
ncbi:MAG: hypothetical protein GX639_18440 [Fibrobacter sp.]|nr:hypothetical protein [Fibrobacter sp.]